MTKFLFDLLFYGGVVGSLFLMARYFWRKKDGVSLPFSTAGTIFIYRLFTFLTIAFFVNTQYWKNVYSDQWNHYYFGLVILLLSPFLQRLIPGKKIVIILGIGLGMIIDEVSDILKLFIVLPYHRDSLQDTLVIVFTYLLFFLIYRIAKRHKGSF